MEAVRKCLRCQNQFNSGGPGNRICPSCGEINAKVKVPPSSPNSRDSGGGMRRGVDVGARHR